MPRFEINDVVIRVEETITINSEKTILGIVDGRYEYIFNHHSRMRSDEGIQYMDDEYVLKSEAMRLHPDKFI